MSFLSLYSVFPSVSSPCLCCFTLMGPCLMSMFLVLLPLGLLRCDYSLLYLISLFALRVFKPCVSFCTLMVVFPCVPLCVFSLYHFPKYFVLFYQPANKAGLFWVYSSPLWVCIWVLSCLHTARSLPSFQTVGHTLPTLTSSALAQNPQLNHKPLYIYESYLASFASCNSSLQVKICVNNNLAPEVAPYSFLWGEMTSFFSFFFFLLTPLTQTFSIWWLTPFLEKPWNMGSLGFVS